MNIVTKNGKLYYEIKEPITFKNYGKKVSGKFVLTKIDNNYRLFIVRPKEKAVAVPFGEFNNEKGKSPFDYIVKNEKIGSTVFTHNHFRSNGVSSYMTKNDKGKIDKVLMDFIWGLPNDKQVKKWKESKEEYKNGNGFTR